MIKYDYFRMNNMKNVDVKCVRVRLTYFLIHLVYIKTMRIYANLVVYRFCEVLSEEKWTLETTYRSALHLKKEKHCIILIEQMIWALNFSNNFQVTGDEGNFHADFKGRNVFSPVLSS